MPFSLADYFQKQGLRVIEASLKAVEGKPTSYLRDEHHYRMHVIQPAWRALPAAVRLLLKRQTGRWDELFFALRDIVFDLSKASVKLRPGGLEWAAGRIRSEFAEGPTEPPLAAP